MNIKVTHCLNSKFIDATFHETSLIDCIKEVYENCELKKVSWCYGVDLETNITVFQLNFRSSLLD